MRRRSEEVARRAALVIDEEQVELCRRVPGDESGHHRHDQFALARPTRSTDQPVRSVLDDVEFERPTIAEPDRSGQRVPPFGHPLIDHPRGIHRLNPQGPVQRNRPRKCGDPLGQRCIPERAERSGDLRCVPAGDSIDVERLTRAVRVGEGHLGHPSAADRPAADDGLGLARHPLGAVGHPDHRHRRRRAQVEQPRDEGGVGFEEAVEHDEQPRPEPRRPPGASAPLANPSRRLIDQSGQQRIGVPLRFGEMVPTDR